MPATHIFNEISLFTAPDLTGELSADLQKIGIRDILNIDKVEEVFTLANRELPSLLLLDVIFIGSVRAAVNVALSINKLSCRMPVIFLVNDLNIAAREELLNVPCATVMSRKLSLFNLLNAMECASLKLQHKQLKAAAPLFNSYPEPVPTSSTSPANEPLFFKVGDKFKRIDTEKIDYFFAEKKMTYARIAGRNLPTNTQLKNLEISLSSNFIRCHKKYLINISHIDNIHFKEAKIQINGELLPIGYVYKKALLQRLNLMR